MKIGVLGWDHGTVDPDSPGLVEAGRRRGHETSLFTLEEVGCAPAGNGFALRFGAEPATAFDAVISRADLHGARWQDRVERLTLVSSVPGLAMFDPADVWVANQSKFRTLQRLAEVGLPIPPTRGCTTLADVSAALADWGDVVVKPSFGFSGTGVERVTDLEGGKAVVEELFERYGTLLAQPFISTADGEYRITVAGDVATINFLKIPAPGQFKCNVDQGAKVQQIDPPADVLDIAIRACRAMGCTLGGVDILPTPDGPMILEVNSVPGKLKIFGEETRQRTFDGVYESVERLTPERAVRA